MNNTNQKESYSSANKTSKLVLFCIVALIFFLSFVNYLDRSVISFAITPICTKFGITNTGFGIATSLFAAGALCINFISGILLDRYGFLLVSLFEVSIWTISMFLLSITEYWSTFLIFRFILGLGEGGNFPAMNKVVRDKVPRKHTAKFLGVCLIGVPGAFLVGGPLFSWLIPIHGWQFTFRILSFTSLILIIMLLTYFRKTLKLISSHFIHSPLKNLLKDRTLIAISWSFFGFSTILYFGLAWVPAYFEQTYNLNLHTIGWFSLLPWGLAAIFILLISCLSDSLYSKNMNVRSSCIYIIIIFQILATACLLPLAFIQSAEWAAIWLSLVIAFSMAPNALYYSILIYLYDKQTGAATGFMITFFSISGLLLPTIIGWLTDLTGSFVSAFILMASIVLSGALGLFFFARSR